MTRHAELGDRSSSTRHGGQTWTWKYLGGNFAHCSIVRTTVEAAPFSGIDESGTHIGDFYMIRMARMVPSLSAT